MPELAETRAGCNPESGTGICPRCDGQADTEIQHERLVAEAGAGGLDQAIVLGFTGRECYRGLRRAPGAKIMLAEHDAATAGRLPRPRTARPVGIAVNVDARRTLKGICINQTLVAKKITTN